MSLPLSLTRRNVIASGAALCALPRIGLATEAPLKIRNLYNKDRSFSDLAQSLEGERILLEGYMAPPLKAEARFFVLTKMPMSVCPFCETEAEWPDDILAIYTKRVVDVISYNVRIQCQGVLELGSFRDDETGFLSLVRLSDATYSEHG